MSNENQKQANIQERINVLIAQLLQSKSDYSAMLLLQTVRDLEQGDLEEKAFSACDVAAETIVPNELIEYVTIGLSEQRQHLIKKLGHAVLHLAEIGATELNFGGFSLTMAHTDNSTLATFTTIKDSDDN